jgi:two-component system response regulator CpxR
MKRRDGEPTSLEGCVLVVDDDEGIREALCELVEMAGCSARSAANGAEALQMLAEGLPCLVILDLLMPVMSGQELLEAMRKEPSLAAVPVVISTSTPDRAPPGVPVIAKPIDINRVVHWMKRTCECAVELPAF